MFGTHYVQIKYTIKDLGSEYLDNFPHPILGKQKEAEAQRDFTRAAVWGRYKPGEVFNTIRECEQQGVNVAQTVSKEKTWPGYSWGGLRLHPL